MHYPTIGNCWLWMFQHGMAQWGPTPHCDEQTGRERLQHCRYDRPGTNLHLDIAQTYFWAWGRQSCGWRYQQCCSTSLSSIICLLLPTIWCYGLWTWTLKISQHVHRTQQYLRSGSQCWLSTWSECTHIRCWQWCQLFHPPFHQHVPPAEPKRLPPGLGTVIQSLQLCWEQAWCQLGQLTAGWKPGLSGRYQSCGRILTRSQIWW